MVSFPSGGIKDAKTVQFRLVVNIRCASNIRWRIWAADNGI
jgi:hypothetical protein